MVRIDCARTRLAMSIYYYSNLAYQAWHYTDTKDADSMAGYEVEKIAMECEDTVAELTSKYMRNYGCLPHGTSIPKGKTYVY